ncbi:MAG: aldo/keto reductase [Candidatus Omnitrophica bacterium]|nr:aldo/keto reductase [Candidatus Omnitrophota bacterium]
MKRRPFLKMVGGVAGSCSVGLQSRLAGAVGFKNRQDETCEIPLREYGKTGEKLPMVVFPGLCLMHYEQDFCTKELHRAVDRGLNFFDVAPAYGRDGDCEKKMGKGLQGIERSRYFLACKTKMRDKEGARLELERSLKRLNTDYFDLYQMHHLRSTDEVKQAFAPGGAMETFFKAKEEGKIRYIGFSAHTSKSALEAFKLFPFDSVMFPINFVEYYSFGFGKEVIEAAEKQGAAILAMKAICGGRWPGGVENTRKWWYRPLEDQHEIDLAVRFSASRKNVVAVIPASFIDLFDKTAIAAKAYREPTPEELAQLQEMASQRLSVFLDEQKKFTMAHPRGDLAFPDSPYEGCPCAHYT